MKGLLYRRGLDPEREYPALWSKIWEALPKWDGRDFRAYIAQLVRNYCLDDLKAIAIACGVVVVGAIAAEFLGIEVEFARRFYGPAWRGFSLLVAYTDLVLVSSGILFLPVKLLRDSRKEK